MVKFLRNREIEILLFLFTLVLVIISIDNPFYWDNIVQISIPAHWYYENNFNSFFLPDEIATGHPTFVGMYFASLWKIFGKSLLVSHLGMFPFLFGFLFQLNIFIKNLQIKNNLRLIILAFVLFDTTILSQMSLITFEVFQLFFYLLCLNSILNNRKVLLSLAFTCLVLVSLRGTICGGGIIIFHFLYLFFNHKKITIKAFLPYTIGLVSIVLFLSAFYLEKNWIIHNTVSNAWKSSSELASLKEIIINIGVFIWRLIDFGRVLVFLLFVVLILKLIKGKINSDNNIKTLLFIILSQFIVFFPIIVIYRNPFGHRYLIPIIIPVIILTIYWIFNYDKKLKSLLPLAFITLISGHFWLYPPKISQGWDSTTLHWNYLNTRKNMLIYLNSNHYNITKIGSFFPNTNTLDYIDLNLQKKRFKTCNLRTDKYILFSNAFNVSDEVINALKSPEKWVLIKEFKKNRIYTRLYKRK
ncbi:hypothetical protein ACS386_05115 [Flavobacteriaceae bacterium LMO-SS05]